MSFSSLQFVTIHSSINYMCKSFEKATWHEGISEQIANSRNVLVDTVENIWQRYVLSGAKN